MTTAAGPQRAPLEMREAVLRVSPHVDTTAADLAVFAAALTEVTGG
ncbi:putative hercynylcysteine sulfoxide lyase [Mycobacterium talmoniae]|uniref:Putative hercynylcysteine sulfoxide lyase n=1 Tax=Mycobacterium talmoniae TaxID=1858794 RepID=A0A2S8BD06_9MYCO|nr:putative hercynylcysteine sulfoxide lyase [Mycobacterium talmoniae]